MKKRIWITPLVIWAICLLVMVFPVQAADCVQLTEDTVKCTMYTGTSKTFQLENTDITKKGKKVWYSSKKSVASVNSKGIVKAKKPGMAMIICKVNGEQYGCTVTVKEQKMSSLKVSGKKMFVGKSGQLTVKIAPSNTYNKTLKYTSSAPSVISVSKNGTVKAKKEGSATITVASLDGSGKKAVCTIQAVKQLKKTSVHFIAHRGLSSEAPENTVTAFKLAGEAGFWGAETDVRVTADGEYILLHDTTFKRMCGVNKKPEKMTLKEIKKLKIKSGKNIKKYKNDTNATHICTLKEYLAICKTYKMVPVIELKMACGSNPKFHGTTFQNVDDADSSFDQTMLDIDKTVSSVMGNRPYIYICFYKKVITQLAKIRTAKHRTNMGLQYLTSLGKSTSLSGKISYCKKRSADWNISDTSVTAGAIAAAKKRHVKINVWTVDDAFQAAYYKSCGADYITTNKILWQ